MKKLICFILLLFFSVNICFSGDNISFLTITGPSLNSVKIQAHNTAYINGMKIIGTKTVKLGDTWVRTVKVTPKYK